MSTAAAKAARAPRETSLAITLRHAFDPAAWANEVFGPTLGFVADVWQERVLRSQAQQQIMASCRQSGKSQCVAFVALHRAIFMPRSLVLIVAPSQRQAAELYRKCLTAMRVMPNPPALTVSNLTNCEMANGSRIVSLPADPDTIRGYSAPSMILCDEAAFFGNSEAVFDSVAPMLAVSKGKLIMLSSPNGRFGFFYRAWSSSDGSWEKSSVRASECPRIDPDWLAAKRRSMASQVFAREFDCVFTDSGAQLFASLDIERAIQPSPDLPLRVVHAVRQNNVGDDEFKNAPVDMPGEAVGFVVACDLGQARDFSTIVVSEVRHVVDRSDDVLAAWENRRPRPSRERTTVHIRVVYMARIQLGTSFPAFVTDVARVMEDLPEIEGGGPEPALWIDAGGVGRGVLDLMEDAGLEPRGITLTGGHDAITHSRRDHRVPKELLIGGLQIMLQTGRVKVAAGVLAREPWISEMLGFVSGMTAAGRETSGADSEDLHDDLVVSVAMCCWAAEHPYRRSTNRFL